MFLLGHFDGSAVAPRLAILFTYMHTTLSRAKEIHFRKRSIKLIETRIPQRPCHEYTMGIRAHSHFITVSSKDPEPTSIILISRLTSNIGIKRNPKELTLLLIGHVTRCVVPSVSRCRSSSRNSCATTRQDHDGDIHFIGET
jgi:hypothetical protein